MDGRAQGREILNNNTAANTQMHSDINLRNHGCVVQSLVLLQNYERAYWERLHLWQPCRLVRSSQDDESLTRYLFSINSTILLCRGACDMCHLNRQVSSFLLHNRNVSCKQDEMIFPLAIPKPLAT